MASIKLTKENFENEIKNSKIIIDFWASWCGPCQMMGPVFEELSNNYDGLKFGKISTEDEPELANRFNIMGIPCLIVLENGKEIDRITGFAPKEILKQKIDSIIEKL